MSEKSPWVNVGNFLFRYRGQIPLLFYLLALVYVIFYPGSPVAGNTVRIFFYFLISLTGLLLRVDTVGHVPAGTSGRNREKQVAETLNTSGWYSVVRHPLYVGNYLLYLGPLMVTESLPFILIYLIILGLYYKLISLAEDHFLLQKFGQAYHDWAASTPAFLPTFKNYRSPVYPFSLRKVLINEYHMILEIPMAFALLVVARQYGQTGRVVLPPCWIIILGIAMLLWIVLHLNHMRAKRQ